MNLLEDIYADSLKPNTASESEFKSKADQVKHDAALVAAMGVILAAEDMDDADDEGYLEYTTAMRDGALQVVAGTQTENYALIESGVNAVGQSCTNCHDDWR